MFISAGHNTTTSAIGNAVLRLARDPELQSRLRDDPEADPGVRRGGRADRRPAAGDAPDRDGRHRARRPADRGGRLRLARLRLGQPRPGGDRAADRLRPRAHAEPPRRLRAWDPPVHRRAARAARAAGRARGAARAHLVVRASTARSTRPAWPRLGVDRFRCSSGSRERSRRLHALAAGCRSPTCAGARPARPDLAAPPRRRPRRDRLAEVAPELAAAGYRVTAPDLRGCGESDWDPEARYGVEQTARRPRRAARAARARVVRPGRALARRRHRVRLRGAASRAGRGAA